MKIRQRPQSGRGQGGSERVASNGQRGQPYSWLAGRLVGLDFVGKPRPELGFRRGQGGQQGFGIDNDSTERHL